MRVKKNNKIVNFDKKFIISSINYFNKIKNTNINAFNIAKEVEKSFDSHETVEINDITKKTIEIIKAINFKIGEEYNIYLNQRQQERNSRKNIIEKIKTIVIADTNDNLKRENANINSSSPMGMMLKIGSETSKEFSLTNLIDEEFSKAHQEGYIHIHDLDFYSTGTTTCCQIDLTKLFKKGFYAGHGFIRSPQTIQSYASLTCIAIQSNQNNQHGGQSIPKFDYDLAEGVKKSFKKNFIEIMGYFGIVVDKNNVITMDLIDIPNIDKDIIQKVEKLAIEKTEKDTYQAMEILIHNLNTMASRAGSQVPFSSINYGTDTSKEGRMVTKQLLLATQSGLGNSETPIFPIQIFKVKEGVNLEKESPNYDLFQLACKTTAKRLFPNFSFLDSSFNKPYLKENCPETEVAYMGCRTRVIGNIDKSKEVVSGRGNLSFTTINLPRLAIESKNNKELFYKKLDFYFDMVVNQLIQRYKFQCSKTPKNFPFLMEESVWIDSETLKEDEKLERVLKQGTLSVGFIGLAETLILLCGDHHGENCDAQFLGLEIVSYLRKRCDIETSKRNLNITLLATPSESLCGRFLKLDREKYGIIKGVTDKEYYTNSFHVPVYYKTSIKHKINVEGAYHKYTNAGHITYCEIDYCDNWQAIETIVNFMKKSDVGYGSINHGVDTDPVCGYCGIIGECCPRCGRKDGERLSDKKVKELEDLGFRITQ